MVIAKNQSPALSGDDIEAAKARLANPPSFEDKAVLEFFEISGRNLLAAEVAAGGVRHHIALSIVGTDRSDNGYFRAKVAQEKLIETSGIPYTIIRSTQFLEVLGGIAASSADGNIVRLSPVLEARLGRIGFEEWLRRSQAAA